MSFSFGLALIDTPDLIEQTFRKKIFSSFSIQFVNSIRLLMVIYLMLIKPSVEYVKVPFWDPCFFSSILMIYINLQVSFSFTCSQPRSQGLSSSRPRKRGMKSMKRRDPGNEVDLFADDLGGVLPEFCKKKKKRFFVFFKIRNFNQF